MDIFLPDGFEAGRARAPKSRPSRVRQLCVEADGVRYAVSRRWAGGFVTAAQDVPTLSGLVNIFNGETHLSQCLITGHEVVGTEQIFKVKQAAPVMYGRVTQGDPVTAAHT